MDIDQARTALDNAREQCDRAEQAAADARARYHRLIADVLREGTLLRTSEIAKITGYNREHVRRIARSHNVPPRR